MKRISTLESSTRNYNEKKANTKKEFDSWTKDSTSGLFKGNAPETILI
jgi:hypothetical protein